MSTVEHERDQSSACQDLFCRRLFLRGWKPAASADNLARPSVNVEVWVRYAQSTAKNDELSEVLDYNVMRDALLQSGHPDSPFFIDRALSELMKAPIEAALVEVIQSSASEQRCESRRATRRP